MSARTDVRQQRVLVLVASLMSTVRELETQQTPAIRGVLYAGVMGSGYSYEEFQAAESVMTQAGWVTVSTDFLQLTESGRAKAEELDAFLAKLRGKA